MAQLLQPLLLLVLLIFTLMYQPRGVTSLAYMDVNSLLEVKNSINRDYLKDIWNRQFKTLVKNVDPGILRARKRGKRAGVRVKHQVKNSRVPLPAIILTNAQSVRYKLDELHGLIQTPRIKNLSQLICITESWLTPDINMHRTELQGYEQFRNDRLPKDSNKSVGGGILFYVDKNWSTNNQVISEVLSVRFCFKLLK